MSIIDLENYPEYDHYAVLDVQIETLYYVLAQKKKKTIKAKLKELEKLQEGSSNPKEDPYSLSISEWCRRLSDNMFDDLTYKIEDIQNVLDIIKNIANHLDSTKLNPEQIQKLQENEKVQSKEASAFAKALVEGLNGSG